MLLQLDNQCRHSSPQIQVCAMLNNQYCHNIVTNLFEQYVTSCTVHKFEFLQCKITMLLQRKWLPVYYVTLFQQCSTSIKCNMVRMFALKNKIRMLLSPLLCICNYKLCKPVTCCQLLPLDCATLDLSRLFYSMYRIL